MKFMSERHRLLLRVTIAMLGTLIFTLSQAESAIVKAKSVSLGDVVSAIRLAHEGDTVVVPAGNASWTSTLRVTKGITLEGAGDDKTVILDDVPRTPLNDGGAILIADLNSKQSFRLTGITFRAGALTTTGNNGAVRIRGTCPAVRIDHCHFDGLHQLCVHTYGCIFGVIDHCIFDCARRSLAILVWHDTWGGKFYGDGSWAEPPYFGSEKFLFIEDNTFNNLGLKQTNGNIDAKRGARYVCRYNKFNNCKPANHGTEGGRERGCRVMEIYNNTFNWTMPNNGGISRSGTVLLHDNTFTGTKPSKGMSFQTFREFFPYRPWGGANGYNAWDVNDSHGLYLSGKHTGTNDSQALVVADAGWKTNQWIGYQVTNKVSGHNSLIKANTSDTISPFIYTDTRKPLRFNTGDTFVIYKVLISLDQPGRGQGDLLSGSTPSNTVTNSIAWPHNALEPGYSWNNKYGTERVYDIHADSRKTFQENRDFYNNTPKPGYKPYTYPHPLVNGTAVPAKNTAQDQLRTTDAVSSLSK
jgi:hypothetical protein